MKPMTMTDAEMLQEAQADTKRLAEQNIRIEKRCHALGFPFADLIRFYINEAKFREKERGEPWTFNEIRDFAEGLLTQREEFAAKWGDGE